MGKASKWFKGLLGLRKWSFVKSHKDHRQNALNDVVSRSENGNLAIAAAVKLARNGGDVNITACVRESGAGYGGREVRAAVMIQSHFRAYLSKRALRALKGLVKLQALVRGHLVRKQTAYAFRQLQALVRAQTRARSGRSLVSQSPHSTFKSSHFTYPDPPTPEKFEHVIRARSMEHGNFMTLKRHGSKSVFRNCERALHRDDELSDTTRELYNQNPHFIPKHKRSLFHSSQSFSTSKESTARQSVLSPLFDEVQSLARDVDQSDGSRSCLTRYSDHPNYMAYTKSSKAKVRSLSAPKLRPIHYERSSSTKKYYVPCGELMTSTQRSSSGRLDRLGMPVRGDDNGFSGGLQCKRY